MNFLAVSVGGGVGALLRYLVILFTVKIAGALPFWATLGINLSGCFVMGAFSLLILPKTHLSEPLRLLLTTGLLGGFTTFSSFSFDAGRLIDDGVFPLAGFYIIASVAGGIIAFFLGQYLAKHF